MKWIEVILQAIGLARDLATPGRKKPKPRFLPKSDEKPIVPRDGSRNHRSR